MENWRCLICGQLLGSGLICPNYYRYDHVARRSECFYMSPPLPLPCPDCPRKDAHIAALKEVVEAMEEFDAIMGHPELWRDQAAYLLEKQGIIKRVQDARAALARLKEVEEK